MSAATSLTERIVVLGAGPSGLGIARQLKHVHGLEPLVVDRAEFPAASWRARYDGFRLNTCGYWSHLPGQRMPMRYGRWPRRDQLVEYFDDYVARQQVRLALGVEAVRVDRQRSHWQISTDREAITASAVVIATGHYHTPWWPSWPGRETYTGEILHAAQYRNSDPFAERDVLVVGAGNSATDIALQLGEGRARSVRLAVRTPPHLVPRSAGGVPIDAFSPAFTAMPVRFLDTAATVARRLWFGDLQNEGLPLPPRGIYTSLREDSQVPTIGNELVRRVKEGRIEVVAAVSSFDTSAVVLADGSSLHPDAVIAATGYSEGLEPLVGHLGVLDGKGRPQNNGVPGPTAGLWFAGYEEPLIGPLRAFRRQASRIAADIARHLASR